MPIELWDDCWEKRSGDVGTLDVDIIAPRAELLAGRRDASRVLY